MLFSVGDKVRIKNHPDNIIGKVTNKNLGDYMFGMYDCTYTVEFDNKGLIPSSMDYEEDQLDLVSKIVNDYGPKCECGAKFTQFPMIHLQYCPLDR